MNPKESTSRRMFMKCALAAIGMSALSVAAKINHDRMVWLEQRRKATDIRLKERVDYGSVYFGGYFGEMDTDEYVANTAVLGDLYNVETIFPTWSSNDWGHNKAMLSMSVGRLPLISLRPYNEKPGHPYNLTHMLRDEKLIRSKMRLYRDVHAWWRYGYEMNGSWFEHGTKYNSPRESIAMYKKFVTIAREEAPNIQHIYCPYSLPGYHVETIDRYYPGDDYVDMAGLNIFRKYTSDLLNPLHYTESNLGLLDICGPELTWYQKQTSSKPIVICELGADMRTDGGVDFVTQAVERLPQVDGVSGVMLFSSDKSHVDWSERDWNYVRKSPENIAKLQSQNIWRRSDR